MKFECVVLTEGLVVGRVVTNCERDRTCEHAVSLPKSHNRMRLWLDLLGGALFDLSGEYFSILLRFLWVETVRGQGRHLF